MLCGDRISAGSLMVLQTCRHVIVLLFLLLCCVVGQTKVIVDTDLLCNGAKQGVKIIKVFQCTCRLCFSTALLCFF